MAKTCFLTFFLIFLFSCTEKEPPTSKPNIIYIMADDLGIGDMGVYGQDSIQTPNLDRLAAMGMQLTNHYSGSTVCAPSRCALMTGKHMGTAEVRSNQVSHIEDEEITVAKVLKKAGYQTGIVGKWGLGETDTPGEPYKQGFDYFFGFKNQIKAHNSFPDSIWENTTHLKLANEVIIADKSYAKGIGSSTEKRGDYIHDLFIRKCLNFIDENKSKPFYLYYAATIPHANNEFWINQEHGMEVKDYGIYADKNWPDVAKAYAAMVTNLDAHVGAILDKLEAEGIADNTLIIFTSDNGVHAEGNYDPDFFNSNSIYRGKKRDLYEGGIRTPHLAVWPGKIKAGSSSDLLSAFWDFLPTAAEIAGVEVNHNIDGISYLPTLLGKEQDSKHGYLYWEFYEQGGKQAIRKGDWKAIRLNTKGVENPAIELYNLADDPGEQRDVANYYPDVVKEMESIFAEAHTPWEHDHLFTE